jgi:hypothetical protein
MYNWHAEAHRHTLRCSVSAEPICSAYLRVSLRVGLACLLPLNDEGRLVFPESPSARTGCSSGLAEDGRILPLRLVRAHGTGRASQRKMGFGCPGDVCVTVHGNHHSVCVWKLQPQIVNIYSRADVSAPKDTVTCLRSRFAPTLLAEPTFCGSPRHNMW